MIDCPTYFGDVKRVERSQLRFRPSAYAVIIDTGRILMIEAGNNKYYFPGGGIELGETLAQTVTREVREELGTDVEVHDLLHAEDRFMYFDPTDEAWHVFGFFLRCSIASKTFDHSGVDANEEVRSAAWIPLAALDPALFLSSTLQSLIALRDKLSKDDRPV